MSRMRISVHVLDVPDGLGSRQSSSDVNKKFLLVNIDPASTLGELWIEIEQYFRRLYLTQSHHWEFEISKLQDEYENDLDVSYKCGDVFSAGPAPAVVRVTRAGISRESSVPLGSSLRPSTCSSMNAINDPEPVAKRRRLWYNDTYDQDSSQGQPLRSYEHERTGIAIPESPQRYSKSVSVHCSVEPVTKQTRDTPPTQTRSPELGATITNKSPIETRRRSNMSISASHSSLENGYPSSPPISEDQPFAYYRPGAESAECKNLAIENPDSKVTQPEIFPLPQPNPSRTQAQIGNGSLRVTKSTQSQIPTPEVSDASHQENFELRLGPSVRPVHGREANSNAQVDCSPAADTGGTELPAQGGCRLSPHVTELEIAKNRVTQSQRGTEFVQNPEEQPGTSHLRSTKHKQRRNAKKYKKKSKSLILDENDAVPVDSDTVEKCGSTDRPQTLQAPGDINGSEENANNVHSVQSEQNPKQNESSKSGISAARQGQEILIPLLEAAESPLKTHENQSNAQDIQGDMTRKGRQTRQTAADQAAPDPSDAIKEAAPVTSKSPGLKRKQPDDFQCSSKCDMIPVNVAVSPIAPPGKNKPKPKITSSNLKRKQPDHPKSSSKSDLTHATIAVPSIVQSGRNKSKVNLTETTSSNATGAGERKETGKLQRPSDSARKSSAKDAKPALDKPVALNTTSQPPLPLAESEYLLHDGQGGGIDIDGPVIAETAVEGDRVAGRPLDGSTNIEPSQVTASSDGQSTSEESRATPSPRSSASSSRPSSPERVIDDASASHAESDRGVKQLRSSNDSQSDNQKDRSSAQALLKSKLANAKPKQKQEDSYFVSSKEEESCAGVGSVKAVAIRAPRPQDLTEPLYPTATKHEITKISPKSDPDSGEEDESSSSSSSSDEDFSDNDPYAIARDNARVAKAIDEEGLDSKGAKAIRQRLKFGRKIDKHGAQELAKRQAQSTIYNTLDRASKKLASGKAAR